MHERAALLGAKIRSEDGLARANDSYVPVRTKAYTAPAPFLGVACTNFYCYNSVMRAAFAVLANLEAYNFVRKLAWGMHFQYRTGTIDIRLPPHVSLKQPFAIPDLDGLEEYMNELAPKIEPFEMELTRLELRSITHQGRDYGLLLIAVQENPTLRMLHNKLNQELTQRFGDARADFDGEEYFFHMTVMMGGQSSEVYRAAFAKLAVDEVNLRYTARHLAMFVYDEPLGPHGEYLTYKILTMGSPKTTVR